MVEVDDGQADIESDTDHVEPARTAQNPPLPLEQRSVQLTVAFLAMVAVAAILWSGRQTYWREASPHDSSIPKPLLEIDINKADAREFALLPGVGPVLAKRIVADRERNGEFATVQDLSRVHGIGAKTIDRIGSYCATTGDPETIAALADD